MAHRLVVDSDEEFFGFDESDEDFIPEDGDTEPEIEYNSEYNSDDSDFDDTSELSSSTETNDDSVLLLSKDGKIQYSRDPPPLGRPVGRNSFSNKGLIIELCLFVFNDFCR